MFSADVQADIGWYVYALRDPRDRRVFYIGKGKGNRVFHHAIAAAEFTTTMDAGASEGAVVGEPEDEASAKIALIREILAAGLEVETFLIRHQISSGADAYEIEAALLDLLRLLDEGLVNDYFNVTNKVWGHHHEERGLVSTKVAASLYEAPDAPPIKEPAILFRIPRLWTPRMTDAELFEATHGWWRTGSRRNGAHYAFAVSRGIIRGVYSIDSWRQRVQGDRDWETDVGNRPRWGFDGQPAPEMAHYLNTSVRHLFKRGDAGVFKYVNC